MQGICVLNICIAKVWGGGEQYVYDTAKEIVKRGIRVYVAVDASNLRMQQRFAEVAEVVGVDLYHAAGLFSVRVLQKFIVRHGITHIYCHSGHALHLCILLKKLCGIRLLFFKHSALPSKMDFYHKWQRRQVDAYICVSKLVYDLQVRSLSDKERGKYHLVYNGIDVEKFDKYVLVDKDKEHFVIGYAGRIAANKGIDVLVEAFTLLLQQYDNLRLRLVGMDDKNYLQTLQEFIGSHNLKDRVEYLGLVDDMELFYKQLDLFVLPSVVKEGFGLVLCEALYCGVPVITTDSGAQKEIVTKNSYGYIVAANDADALRKKIAEVYDNNTFVAAEAREYILENFSVEICVNRLLKICQGLLH